MMLLARERKLTLGPRESRHRRRTRRPTDLDIRAGAIAELDRELAGEVILDGKPDRSIYERAMALVLPTARHPADRLDAPGRSAILVRTIISLAQMVSDLIRLFVTGGIHLQEFEGIDQLDPGVSQGNCSATRRGPSMRESRW